VTEPAERAGRAPGPGSAPAAVAARTYRVRGLDCAEEVAALRDTVGPLVGGGDKLAFDLLNGRMTLLPGARPVSDARIARAARRAGLAAEPWRTGEAAATEGLPRGRLWLTAASGVALAVGLAVQAGEGLFGTRAGAGLPLAAVLAYALAIALAGRPVVVKAWWAARRLRPDIHLLMTLAVAGAIGIGEWFEAATVTFLFALSLALEGWSVGRARRAISALLRLAPETVRVRLDSGEERATAATEVAVGTRFVVHAGERIALDGRVVAGESAVDQAPITGESVPVAKGPGDAIYAGTINREGVLEVASTKAAGETTLARIIRMVEEAQGRRARVEQWVERFARVYTPIVIVLALAVCLVPPLAFGLPWQEWFYRALVLLVIACPCALVISTPVSIVAALACAARAGVLVKGGNFLELPARLAAVAFDKTGTLTCARPEVVALVPLDGHSERELLERAAALEARSNHPLAGAILACARARGMAAPAAESLRLLPGKGVTGEVAGERFWLGSDRYRVERGLNAGEAAARAEALEREGKTVIMVGNERHVCGLVAVADAVRPGAAEAVARLRALGVRRLVMLTGDNRATAEAIAREVGLDAVHAELLPEDKMQAISRLVASHGTVAMVGDGVNDAPAMAQATLGIAMGAAGSDVAIETADVALMTDDLGRLPWLVAHARRTVAIVRENIVCALAVKAVFVALALAGLASLWGAIAADVGASLVVVANALRLLKAPAGTALPVQAAS